jgi:uncharacterized repeat protein (TIGR01451 family)
MKFSQKLLIVLSILSLNVKNINAQQLGAKDCFEAIPLLNWETITYGSSGGEGIDSMEVNNSTSCLSSGERNSSWFVFYTSSDGLVSFSIIPECEFADYDWAVFDITEVGCAGIATDPMAEVSCNFSGSTFPSSTGANGGPNPQDEPPIQAEAGRIYVLLVNNFSGDNMCGYSINFGGTTAQLGEFNEVIGNVNYDNNDICGDGIEMPVHNQRINVLNENNELISSAYSREDGSYNAYLAPGQGSISVEIAEITEPFEASCFPASQTIVFNSDTGTTITNIDFAIRPTQICDQYIFDYSALFFRRCFSTTSFVRIANRGTTNSPVDFTLTYPSYQVYPLWASIPYDSLGNNVYLFHAPSIETFQEINVSILDTATCANQLNSFICVEGALVNNNNCIEENAEALKLAMYTDENANQIVVKNFGETAMPNYFTLYINNDYDTLNNMFQSSNYYSFTLQPNETFNGNVFSENWTSVLTDSEGNNESLFISNAINNSLTDTLISLQFPSSDSECAHVVGSYDPNDKQGFPEGFGELNRIEKEQNINYRIRFQNTGSDTAFTVVILDTLSAFLDYTSVIPGASSHPYTFYHEDNKLEFRFNNIDLVQKSLNEPASIGFVEFKVKQRPSNPISYTIENQAAIYFDFNDPIYTPVHVYSIYPLPLGLEGIKELEMNVSPNPSTGLISLNFTEKWQGIQKTIQVSDLSGRIIKTIETSESTPNFDWNELPQGTYIISVRTKSGLGASARWTKI